MENDDPIWEDFTDKDAGNPYKKFLRTICEEDCVCHGIMRVFVSWAWRRFGIRPDSENEFAVAVGLTISYLFRELDLFADPNEDWRKNFSTFFPTVFKRGSDPTKAVEMLHGYVLSVLFREAGGWGIVRAYHASMPFASLRRDVLDDGDDAAILKTVVEFDRYLADADYRRRLNGENPWLECRPDKDYINDVIAWFSRGAPMLGWDKTPPEKVRPKFDPMRRRFVLRLLHDAMRVATDKAVRVRDDGLVCEILGLALKLSGQEKSERFFMRWAWEKIAPLKILGMEQPDVEVAVTLGYLFLEIVHVESGVNYRPRYIAKLASRGIGTAEELRAVVGWLHYYVRADLPGWFKIGLAYLASKDSSWAGGHDYVDDFDAFRKVIDGIGPWPKHLGLWYNPEHGLDDIGWDYAAEETMMTFVTFVKEREGNTPLGIWLAEFSHEKLSPESEGASLVDFDRAWE